MKIGKELCKEFLIKLYKVFKGPGKVNIFIQYLTKISGRKKLYKLDEDFKRLITGRNFSEAYSISLIYLCK